jgi:hypothetical protein
VSTLLHAIVYVLLHNLLNILVQIANKMGLQKNVASVGYYGYKINKPLHSNGHLQNITHVGGSHTLF